MPTPNNGGRLLRYVDCPARRNRTGDGTGPSCLFVRSRLDDHKGIQGSNNRLATAVREKARFHTPLSRMP